MILDTSQEFLRYLFSQRECYIIFKMQRNKKLFNLKNEDLLEDDIADKVTDHIYIGSYQSSKNRQFLKEHNITRVVFCIRNKNLPFPNELVYCKVPINGMRKLDLPGVNVRVFFQQVFEFIQESIAKDEKVLVHCIAGISRSATILASYLMRKMNIGHIEALKMIKEKRKIIDPNNGFIDQLKQYEQYLKDFKESGG